MNTNIASDTTKLPLAPNSSGSAWSVATSALSMTRSGMKHLLDGGTGLVGGNLRA